MFPEDLWLQLIGLLGCTHDQISTGHHNNVKKIATEMRWRKSNNAFRARAIQVVEDGSKDEVRRENADL